MRLAGLPLAFVMAANVLAAENPSPPTPDPRQGRQWWESMYGRLTPGDYPLVERAQSVLGALWRQGGGERLAVPPELLVLRDRRQQPLALALPDGTVVLSREGLDLCYGGVPTGRGAEVETRAGVKAGDTRLGLVLAHEIAHLLRDDGWHMAAFVEALPPDARSPVARVEVAQADELRADADAVLMLLAAGYQPDLVLRPAAFLEQWAGRHWADHDANARRTHPEVSQRIAVMQRRLEAVAEAGPRYQSGLELFAAHRWAEARDSFQDFQRRTRFEGRELLSNLGACEYQLAWRALRRCGDPGAMRFRLTPFVDDISPASRVRLRGTPEGCRASPGVRLHIEAALGVLRRAVTADPGYPLARLNLASALILAGEFYAAAGEADRAAESLGGSSKAARLDIPTRCLHGVASFLAGQQAGAPADRPRASLEQLAREAPRDVAVAYNLARITHESGTTDEARARWSHFLEMEGEGPFADAARLALQSLGDPLADTPRVATP